jgi:hypothetical protein
MGFRRTLIALGGGRKIPYPKWVWAPSGGFYGAQQNNPENWKRNTAFAMAAMGVCVSVIWNISERSTVSKRIKYSSFLIAI